MIAAASVVMVIALGVGVGLYGYRLLTHQTVPGPVAENTSSSRTIISGSIQYNGIRPMTSEEGRVVLYRRGLGEQTFSQLPVTVSLTDDATWSWDGAQSGQTYELQASVEFAGKEIARSNTIVVTAPASGEQLTFNVTTDQLSSDVIPTPQLLVLPNPTPATPVATKQPVAISGRVNLSGYIPPTARLALKSSLESENNFQIVTTDIEPKDNAVWVWSTAEAGKLYKVILELLDKDVIIGRSEQTIVAAPATNQYLQLTSTAQPSPAPQGQPGERASITGKIDLNGPVANNSSILLLQRLPGEKNYTPVARIPAGDGQTWSFDKAVSGTQYEMTAALQVNQENTSTANAVTLTAPAANVVFRINTNVSLDAPGQPHLLTCGDRKADGKWPAQIIFDQVQNANSYWIEVGTAAGKNDVYNERRSRSKSNEEKVTIDFEGNKTYYVRYAQAQCSDCRSDQDYSGFSESVSMSCSN
jgi:hypothetical protein